MKKLLAILLITTTAFGQTANYLVVSVSGEADITIANQLSGEIIGLATESNLFSVLPGERAFKEELVKARNEDGVVNDETIKTLAKNAKANYLCIAKMEPTFDGKKKIALTLYDLKLGKDEPMQTISTGRTAPITLENSTQFDIEIGKATSKMLEEYKRKTTPPSSYQVYYNPYLTKAEKFGTFILNHAFGMGSFVIQDNTNGAVYILVSGAAGAALYYVGKKVIPMPDRSDFDKLVSFTNGEDWVNSDGEAYKDVRENRLYFRYWCMGLGIGLFILAEGINIYQSFYYNKDGTYSLDTRNFNLAVLPTRNGNAIAYGLTYNRRF